MAQKPPDPSVVLQIFRDRVAGIPAVDTARKHGYQPKTLTAIAKKYGLDEIEREIRQLITGQASDISPEMVELNRKYDTRIGKISDLIYEQTESVESQRFETPLEKMRFLEVAAKGLEATRQSQLKIAAGAIDGRKKQAEKKGPDEEKSEFADLADELDEEDA